jgi:hypothetical protein
MKLTIFFLLLFTSITASANFDQTSPALVKVSPKKVYVPKGFDSNDQVQVVAEGAFPNGCYKPGDATAKVDHESKEIVIQTNAYKYQGICIQVIVNYSQVINMGVLQEGVYKVINEADDSVLTEITIKAANTSDPDDFIYAPINQALISKIDGETNLVLTGTFTNSCMSLKEVIVTSDADSMVVQPIVEVATEDCEDGNFPFRYNRAIPNLLSPGRYLLHVRSMNGRAFNNLIDIN